MHMRYYGILSAASLLASQKNRPILAFRDKQWQLSRMQRSQLLIAFAVVTALLAPTVRGKTRTLSRLKGLFASLGVAFFHIRYFSASAPCKLGVDAEIKRRDDTAASPAAAELSKKAFDV